MAKLFVTRAYLVVQFKNFWTFIQSKFIKKIKVNGEEVAVNAEDGSVNIEIPEGAEYSLAKAETAAEGFLATYHLTKNGENVGEAINIPKDYLVKEAAVKTVETENEPVEGYAVGEKYIDFTVNTKGKDGNETHLYIRVADLVKPYTFGFGIEHDEETNAVAANKHEVLGITKDLEEYARSLGWEDADISHEAFEDAAVIHVDGFSKNFAFVKQENSKVYDCAQKSSYEDDFTPQGQVILVAADENYYDPRFGDYVTPVQFALITDAPVRRTAYAQTRIRLSVESGLHPFGEAFKKSDGTLVGISEDFQVTPTNETVIAYRWKHKALDDYEYLVGEHHNIDFETELTA